MASIYRRTYKAPDGSARKYAEWTAEICDANGIHRRIAGFADRGATVELARKCEKLAAHVATGKALDAELREWLKVLPVRQKKRLASLGLLDAATLGAGRLIGEHLDDFKHFLESPERENTADYVTVTHSRCKAIIDGIEAKRVADLTLTRVSKYLQERRDGGLSVKSSNHYAAAIRGFAIWLTSRLQLPANPLDGLTALTVKHDDRKRVRRALEVGELAALLEKTRTGPVRHGMIGAERAALYRLAAESGLRSNEIRSLTVASFELGESPSVTLQAEHAKNRKRATIPLRDELVAELREVLASKLPGAKAFNLPHENVMAAMLKKDLLAADVAYTDESGRVADFHSLRVTCATHLLASGTDLRTAQEILRHSTAALTGDVYARVLKRSARDAIARLPSFNQPAAKAATGTHGDGQAVGAGKSIGGPTGGRTGGNAIPGHSSAFPAGRDTKVASGAKTAGFSGESRELAATGMNSRELGKKAKIGSGWESNPPSPTGVRLQRF